MKYTPKKNNKFFKVLLPQLTTNTEAICSKKKKH